MAIPCSSCSPVHMGSHVCSFPGRTRQRLWQGDDMWYMSHTIWYHLTFYDTQPSHLVTATFKTFPALGSERWEALPSQHGNGNGKTQEIHTSSIHNIYITYISIYQYYIYMYITCIIICLDMYTTVQRYSYKCCICNGYIRARSSTTHITSYSFKHHMHMLYNSHLSDFDMDTIESKTYKTTKNNSSETWRNRITTVSSR